MLATLQNSGMLFSMAIFFTVIVVGLSSRLPAALLTGLTAAGLPHASANAVSHLPPTAALFSSFLGYNPMGHLLPPSVLGHLSAAARTHLLSRSFFPNLIAPPFMAGLRWAFYVSAVMSLVAAIASLLRGKRFIHGATQVTLEPQDAIELAAVEDIPQRVVSRSHVHPSSHAQTELR
jgi:hypothetical protein